MAKKVVKAVESKVKKINGKMIDFAKEKPIGKIKHFYANLTDDDLYFPKEKEEELYDHLKT